MYHLRPVMRQIYSFHSHHTKSNQFMYNVCVCMQSWMDVYIIAAYNYDLLATFVRGLSILNMSPAVDEMHTKTNEVNISDSAQGIRRIFHNQCFSFWL